MKETYNLKNPAVKRIMQEARELATESCYEYEAHPLEDNIFEWHFTVRGPGGTEFEDGRYHGRILLPAEYPFKPPELIFLTPNGRFELNTKVCLSVTGYHPEFWQPAWGIRTVILAVMGFFPTEARGAIGGLDYTKEERRVFAKKSKTWTCSVCNISNNELLQDTAPHHQKNNQEDNVPDFSLSYKPNNSTTTTTTTTASTSSNGQRDELDQQNQSQDASPSSVGNSPDIPSQSKDNPATASSSSSSSSSSQFTRSIPTQPPASSRTSIDTSTTRRPPLWLDGLIGVLLALLVTLIVRRFL
ncbi:hypothetical protein O0I10_012909 [Lichtheimia ornata]|uniref:UBC core domain-containing protein n=1 Tax=Lichtheimia ornata TaxID=688661 RepID=A0AAD7XSP9_9FUNG|nr:uncharacterized protein O0I10_012909 [Lichtheimia ornata]KAJ8651531.1 hypothetical protein O0I10_012909 [Lichtheimia ornata]